MESSITQNNNDDSTWWQNTTSKRRQAGPRCFKGIEVSDRPTMEEIDSLRDRAREDKYARLNMQDRDRQDSTIPGSNDKEENVITLSYQ
jgi:hypothetical protein